jgi:TolB-like protein/Tfp pilus assembly protein PilF
MLEGTDVGDGEQQVNADHACARTVFLSHASEDSAVALSVCEALEHAGMTCWIAPRDVTPGAFYADEIVHAIDAAKALVLILSQHAAASPHVLREVERATSKGHPLVSTRIDQAPLPAGLEYFLNTSHWLDASKCEIARVMPKLVTAVRRAVEMPTSAAVSITATAATHYPSRNTLRRVAIATGCLIALTVAGFAAFSSWQAAHRAAAPATAATAVAAPSTVPEKSVAVLPFVDMSEKKDQEYFSDGLSEELIDMLTRVPDLRVPARTSSFYFKGKQATIGEIAKALGVAHVLEGSIRKNGRTLRITAQLIRADTGYHLWSKTYDRQLDDIFRIQDEIAGAVVSALQVSLSKNAVMGASKSSSADSYTLLMQAQYFLFRQTLEDQRKASDYYKRAIESNQTSAAAWGGLSRATANLWALGVLSWKDAHSDALRAAERAVALDPQLADAHIALGKVALNMGQDYATAKREFDHARALEPDGSGILFWCAVAALVSGDLANAIQLSQQAAAKDPLDGETEITLGQSYYYAGRLEEAKNAYRKALDLIPSRPGLHAYLGVVLLAQGEREEALQEIGREEDPDERDTALAGAYHLVGRIAEARTALAQLEATRAETDAYVIAKNFALRGDREQTFRWLDRGYLQHEYQMEVKVDPWFNSIRGDPRYEALLRKLKLPD